MFFNSVKEINRLEKEINRLLSKGMSNIYSQVTIEKKWLTQNFDFKSLKSLSPGQFLGSSNLFSNFLLQLQNQRLFYYFYFERNYDVLKSKNPCFLLKFNKAETELRMENPTHSFREMNHMLQLL